MLITGITLTGPMNGFELTRHVHESHEVPVVMIAPPVMESDFVHQLAWAEPEAVVFKPIRPADVKSAVQLAIARRSVLPCIVPTRTWQPSLKADSERTDASRSLHYAHWRAVRGGNSDARH